MTEMLLIAMALIVGFAAGIFVGKLIYTPPSVGTLRVDDESDPESSGPLVMLEIDRGHYEDLYLYDHVVCKVDHTPYVPQK